MLYSIGSQTALDDRGWIKAFLATLNKDGEVTYETYKFYKDNRHIDDGLDEELEIYQAMCNELGIEF